MTDQNTQSTAFWARLKGPAKVGLVCALLGMLLAIVGIVRGAVPLRPVSIFLALLISGGTWGIVSWAIATAALDVDRDVADAEAHENRADGDRGA